MPGAFSVRNGWKADTGYAVIRPMVRALTLGVISAACLGACGKSQTPKPHLGVYDAARCGGVRPNWSKQGTEFGELAFISGLAVGPSRLKWNGQSTTSEALSRALVEQREMTPYSSVQVVFEVGTDCSLVQATRANVDTAFHCDGKHKCIEYTDAELDKFLPPPPKR